MLRLLHRRMIYNAKQLPVAPILTTTEEIDSAMAEMVVAQEQFATFSQKQTDRIFKEVALAANQLRLPLAQWAVLETGRGVVEDKVIKNHFASEYIYNRYKKEKSCDIIERDEVNGIIKVAGNCI